MNESQCILPSSSLCVGKHAVPNLVANLPGGGQSQPARALSEETVVSVLSTMVEVVGSSVDAAKTLRGSQGIERLVLINKDRCIEVILKNCPVTFEKPGRTSI